jgi:hypothetical protein
MPGRSDYAAKTLEAVARYSGGLCYYPGCPRPVTTEVNGEIRLTVEVVPIRGAAPESPRYDSAMTDDQRQDLRNLLLLCDQHRREVDAREIVYPVEVLHRWKAQRESDHASALRRLREVAPSGLRTVVGPGLQEHDARLLNAIGRLEETDSEAAKLLRSLLDELTESYTRQQGALDPAMVNDFYMATRQLARMQDVLEEYAAAVHLSFKWQPLSDQE